MKNFKTYQKALLLYKLIEKERFPYFLKDQVLRAASSIVLNLAEGSAKMTDRDQKKFYFISLGSLKETKAICEIQGIKTTSLLDVLNEVQAMVWGLIKSRS